MNESVRLREHPLRSRLHEEVHWQPYEPVTVPADALFVVATDVSPEKERAWLDRLSRALGAPKVEPDAVGTWRLAGSGWRLAMQRHVECSRYLFLFEQPKESDPFAHPLWSRMPAEVRSAMPGTVLTAARFALRPAPAELDDAALTRTARSLFPENLMGGLFGRSSSAVFTDLSIDSEGLVRYLVYTRAESPLQNGRLLGRLMDIEAYRLLALLALPDASHLLDELPELEKEFRRVASEIAEARQTSDEKALEDLLALGLKVEHYMSAQARRIKASHAYFLQIERRMRELDEQPLAQIQPLSVYLNRRLEGARETIADVGTWMEQLSSRIGAVSGLLRTRVNVHQERQSQELLSAMNRRFSLQLRLQQAAELLSVAIFTYYSTHLLADVAEFAAGLMHTHVENLAVRGIAAPFFAGGAIWWLLRRRQRISGAGD